MCDVFRPPSLNNQRLLTFVSLSTKSVGQLLGDIELRRQIARDIHLINSSEF